MCLRGGPQTLPLTFSGMHEKALNWACIPYISLVLNAKKKKNSLKTETWRVPLLYLESVHLLFSVLLGRSHFLRIRSHRFRIPLLPRSRCDPRSGGPTREPTRTKQGRRCTQTLTSKLYCLILNFLFTVKSNRLGISKAFWGEGTTVHLERSRK